MHKLVWQVVLGLLLLIGAAGAARARELALLIGVAGYDSKTNDFGPLHGPRNDVTIMWRLLKKQGFKDEDMVVLADGLPTMGNYPKVQARPTRAAIEEAFTSLAKRARKDDFVYIHISSHGSEQSVQLGGGDQNQPWNRNQVMLPIDVASSTDTKIIPNGLPDYKLGELLDKVRSHAGRVWTVIDMCHAGDATRGTDLAARYVKPEALGIKFPAQPSLSPPPSAQNGQKVTARGGVAAAHNRDGLAPMVAFYAVDPSELSFEKSFPDYDPPLVGADHKQDVLGVFTYLVHRALLSGNNRTYRDLHDEILRELGSGQVGAGMPVPMFEGDLDAPVFGLDNPVKIPKGWPARYHDNMLDISAGVVQGLTPNSLVVIHTGTSDRAADEIGRAKVETAQAASSRATLQMGNGAPALAQDEDVWVTLAKGAVSFVYKISEPPANERNGDNAAMAFAAIDKLKRDKVNNDGIAAEWLSAGSDQADFRLRVKDGTIWITQAEGMLNTDPDSPYTSPGVEITDAQNTADKLFNALWSLARAHNLVRLASSYSPQPPPPGNLVDISAERYSRDEVGPSKPDDTGPAEKGDCPDKPVYRALAQQKPGTPIGPKQVSELRQCDMVAIRLWNRSQSFVDAIVLYVDARGGVQFVPAVSGPRGNTCSIPLPPGSSQPLVAAEEIAIWDKSKPLTAGTEYMVVIAAERAAGAAQTCFRALTQSTLEGVKGQLREGTKSALQSLLENAALAQPGTRAGLGVDEPQLAGSTMSLYPFRVTDRSLRMTANAPAER